MIKSVLAALAFLILSCAVSATDNCSNLPAPAVLSPNGLAPTPTMGWNSWYPFGTSITETQMKAQADLFVSTGLAAAGYKYVNIDDGWEGGRDGSNHIFPNATQAPTRNWAAPIAASRADRTSLRL